MTTLTFFGPIQDTAAHTSLARQPADPQLEVSETIPPHITSKGSVRTAPLEHYITLASRDCLQRPTPTAIFRHATEVPPPILRSDQDNRVLIFPGAFNPSHLGHATLLWHIYLSLFRNDRRHNPTNEAHICIEEEAHPSRKPQGSAEFCTESTPAAAALAG
jgi:hypothetical protein